MPYNPNDSVVLQSQISDIQSELHLLTQNLAGGDGDLEERALWRAKQERLPCSGINPHARPRQQTHGRSWQLAEARRSRQSLS